MAAIVYLLNGPNLNLLGAREPEVYGTASLADIEADAKAAAGEIGLTLECRQSNHEGVLVDWVQEADAKADGLIINPGAYTHTSVALFDALSAAGIPKIELHLSNIHAARNFADDRSPRRRRTASLWASAHRAIVWRLKHLKA